MIKADDIFISDHTRNRFHIGNLLFGVSDDSASICIEARHGGGVG